MHVCMYVGMYIMDHMNCIRIKSARQFSHILVDVMKRGKGMELSIKLKTTDYKKMEIVELFHPVTYSMEMLQQQLQ